MSLVLDASAALAWGYSDERGEVIDQVLHQVTQSGAWVPAIWPIEIANSLELSVRKRRIDRAMRDSILKDLAALRIAVDPETHVHAWTTTLALAERFRLTVYDAAYLELAQRRDLPLASLDGALRKAGELAGVRLLGL